MSAACQATFWANNVFLLFFLQKKKTAVKFSSKLMCKYCAKGQCHEKAVNALLSKSGKSISLGV